MTFTIGEPASFMQQTWTVKVTRSDGKECYISWLGDRPPDERIIDEARRYMERRDEKDKSGKDHPANPVVHRVP